MWYFESFYGLIHEFKHKEISLHSSSEDVFIIKASLDVVDAAVLVVVYIQGPIRA